jgi:hypothetical protein
MRKACVPTNASLPIHNYTGRPLLFLLRVRLIAIVTEAMFAQGRSACCYIGRQLASHVTHNRQKSKVFLVLNQLNSTPYICMGE